jgi:hypothetical protein
MTFMAGTLKKLKKLRGRSLEELRARTAQTLAACAERRGLSAQARLPGDASFFRMMDAEVTACFSPKPARTFPHAHLATLLRRLR